MLKTLSSKTAGIVCALLSLCAALNAQNATAAHSFRETKVCAQAEWVLHLSVHSIWNDDPGPGTIRKMPQEKLDKMDEVADFIGAEPMQDIYGITFYSPSARNEEMVVLFQGDFDTPHMMELLNGHDIYQTFSRKDRSIHRWDAGETRYGTFADPSTIIMSRSRENLENGLDVFDGEAPNIADEQRLPLVVETPFEVYPLGCATELYSSEYTRQKPFTKADFLLLHVAELVPK